MKTKEEIEKLSRIYENYNESSSELEQAESAGRYHGYKKGYTQCQEEMKKELYEFGKLVLDTFHSEGRTHSGKDRLSRIKFDEWFNEFDK